MSLDECLIGAVEDGHIRQSTADEVKRDYERIKKANPGSGSRWEKAAAKRLQEEIERNLRRKQRARVIQVQKNAGHVDGIGAAGDRGEAYAKSVLLEDHSNEFGIPSVEGRSKDLFKEALAPITDGIFKFRQKLNPLDKAATKADNQDLLAAAYGEQGASAEARAFTDGLEEGKTTLVRHVNRHGGNILERKRHIVTQSHDVDKIRAAGKETWIADTIDLVDETQMFDKAGWPLKTEQQVRDFLSAAYDNIVKDGTTDDEFLADLNNLTSHREIAFNGSRDHLAYAEKYGNDDIFGTMLNDVEHRAKLAAVTEVLGPEPRSGLRAMKAAVGEQKSTVNTLDQFYDQALGLSDPFSGSVGAKVSRAIRMIASAAKLGAAPITALTDLGTITRTIADSAGWSQVPRAYGQMLRQLNPASEADRKTAARMEFVADRLTGAISVGSRFLGEGQKAGMADVIADQVFRKTGLTHWTDAGRTAVPMAMLDTMTTEAGKSFDQLGRKLRRTMERHGITAEDWDALRSSSLWTSPDNGSEWLSLANMVRDADSLNVVNKADIREARLATKAKFTTMFRKLSEQGVIGATGRSQVALRGGAKRGSTIDELGLKNLLLWKSIIGGMFDIIGGATRQRYREDGPLAAINYASGMIVGLTVMGGMAVQLSNISKGPQPRGHDFRAIRMEVHCEGRRLGHRR